MGLLNSTVLDWAIGIVFVYLLLAIICTTVNEWIAGIGALRAKTLAKGIGQLLDNQQASDAASFLEEFYKHPLISGMLKPGKTGTDAHPSYLPSRTFATAVMDLATKGIQGSIKFSDLEDGAKKLPDGDVKRALLSLLQNANGDLDRAQKNIEQWFDDSMERVSGWYKRHTQVITVCVAMALTILTNADTMRIARILWTNATVRAVIVQAGQNKSETRKEADAQTASVEYPKNDPMHPVVKLKAQKDELDKLKLVLGWSGEKLCDWKAWPSRLLGWILSIVAISLGAPFWFDTLNKLMNIRNAGKKPTNSDDQKGNNGGSSPGKTAAQQAQAPG